MACRRVKSACNETNLARNSHTYNFKTHKPTILHHAAHHYYAKNELLVHQPRQIARPATHRRTPHDLQLYAQQPRPHASRNDPARLDSLATASAEPRRVHPRDAVDRRMGRCDGARRRDAVLPRGHRRGRRTWQTRRRFRLARRVHRPKQARAAMDRQPLRAGTPLVARLNLLCATR